MESTTVSFVFEDKIINKESSFFLKLGSSLVSEIIETDDPQKIISVPFRSRPFFFEEASPSLAEDELTEFILFWNFLGSQEKEMEGLMYILLSIFEGIRYSNVISQNFERYKKFFEYEEVLSSTNIGNFYRRMIDFIPQVFEIASTPNVSGDDILNCLAIYYTSQMLHAKLNLFFFEFIERSKAFYKCLFRHVNKLENRVLLLMFLMGENSRDIYITTDLIPLLFDLSDTPLLLEMAEKIIDVFYYTPIINGSETAFNRYSVVAAIGELIYHHNQQTKTRTTTLRKIADRGCEIETRIIEKLIQINENIDRGRIINSAKILSALKKKIIFYTEKAKTSGEEIDVLELYFDDDYFSKKSK